MKQSIKCKVCSNFVNGPILWNGPPSRGIWWSRAVLHEWAHSVEWTPIRGIWWSRAVLHKVEPSGGQEQYYVNGLILWNGPPPPVEASGGQEQYYVRSSRHWVMLWVMLTFRQT